MQVTVVEGRAYNRPYAVRLSRQVAAREPGQHHYNYLYSHVRSDVCCLGLLTWLTWQVRRSQVAAWHSHARATSSERLGVLCGAVLLQLRGLAAGLARPR